MRVLMAHNRYQHRGGEDVVFEAETELLRSRGHTVFPYERCNSEIAELSLLDRARLFRRTIWAPDSVAAVQGIIQRQRPDVAYFHNTFPLISPAVYSACTSAGVAVVQVLPNYRLICPGAMLLRDGRPCELCVSKIVPWPGVRHACYRSSLAQSAAVTAMLSYHRVVGTWAKHVDAFIALTEFARRKFIEGGLPAEKLVVKPNFVDPDPGPRAEDSRFALFVGRLSLEKGVRTLLHAWRELRDVPLKVVGDGPLNKSIADTVTQQRLTKVEPLGWLTRDQTMDLMKRATLLVFPSECYEGFPMTIVEALACGLPVVGARLGGTAEIVQHGVSGLHFEPGDPAELAAMVRKIWSSALLRERLSAGARRSFEKHHTADKNYALLMDILQKAVAQRT